MIRPTQRTNPEIIMLMEMGLGQEDHHAIDERLIGLVKRALHKANGEGSLKWDEFKEILLDIVQLPT